MSKLTMFNLRHYKCGSHYPTYLKLIDMDGRFTDT